jgi:hypothetical protein
VWNGVDLAMAPLDAYITGSAAVNWRLYLNSLTVDDPAIPGANFDANGNWLGISTAYIMDGPSFGHDGLEYNISSDGTISLTSSGAISEAPYILGILAQNQSDPSDSIGSRILVSRALINTVNFDTINIENSTNFDNLTAGTQIAAAGNTQLNTTTGNSSFVGTPPATYEETQIAAGSMWRNECAPPTDNTIAAVPLTIVDLATDGDLPPAAAAKIGGLSVGNHIAGGNALKASFSPISGTIGPRGISGTVQNDGFRLQSMPIQGMELGDIVTFSLSVASDAADSNNLPQYQFFLSSGFGGTIYGTDVRVIQSLVNIAQGGASPRPRLNWPLADEGWHILTINYSPGATRQYFDTNNDGDFGPEDEAFLDGIIDGFEGNWTGSDENSVVFAGVQVRTHGAQTANTVNVWLDNLNVYRSAFEIDLALDNEVLTPISGNSSVDNLVTGGVLLEPTGDLDGSLESAAGGTAAQLSAVGFEQGLGGGPEAAFEDPDKIHLEGSVNNTSLGNRDHTRNAISTRSLRFQLAGNDGTDGGKAAGGDFNTIRNGIQTSVMDCGGISGLYAVEVYVAKDNSTNAVANDRDPEIRILLREAAPNSLGPATGVIMNKGGLPDVDDAAPYNWYHAVATMYVPDAEAVFGQLFIFDTFVADVNNFNATIYFDDWSIVRIGDGANVFDAELFDI